MTCAQPSGGGDQALDRGGVDITADRYHRRRGLGQIQPGEDAPDQRQIVVAAIFQDVVGHGDIFQGARRLLYQLVHLGVRSQVHDDIDVCGIRRMANTAPEMAIGPAEIL